MQQVNSGQPFAFVYPAFDQLVDLDVAGLVYDVSSGSAVLLDTVPMVATELGVYVGVYTGTASKTYLVIAAVYTDDTYVTPDTDYAPWAECYSVGNPGSTFLAFNYGAFDMDETLNLGGSVYDVTTGTPDFVDQVVMPHVALGVYFGSLAGELDKTYSLVTAVYTDSGLTIPDTGRAPGSDVFQCYTLGLITNVIRAATLRGQSLSAVLKGE